MYRDLLRENFHSTTKGLSDLEHTHSAGLYVRKTKVCQNKKACLTVLFNKKEFKQNIMQDKGI